MPERAGEDLAEMAAALRASGYLVVKIPPCDRAGTGHGRHDLLRRAPTAYCEGEEPIPHGLAGSNLGTFGWWRRCRCGRSFNDNTEPPTAWDQHKEENGV